MTGVSVMGPWCRKACSLSNMLFPCPGALRRGQRGPAESAGRSRLKSPGWDPARGALLAEREDRGWRYLSGPTHGKPRPRGPHSPAGIQGPALVTGSLSPHICHCSQAVSEVPTHHIPCFPLQPCLCYLCPTISCCHCSVSKPFYTGNFWKVKIEPYFSAGSHRT